MSLPADGGRELVHQPRAPRPWSGACLSARALLSPRGAPWDRAPSAHRSHLLWSAPHGGSVPSLSRLPTPSRGIPRWRSRFLRHHAVPTPGHSGLPTPSPPHPSVLPALPTCAERPPRVTRRPARLSPRPSSSSSPARPPPPPSSKCLQPLCSLTFCSEIILDLQKGAETQSQEAPSACVPCPPTPGMTSPGTRIKTPIRTVPVPHSRGTS